MPVKTEPTPRQVETLHKMASQGAGIKTIARALGLSGGVTRRLLDEARQSGAVSTNMKHYRADCRARIDEEIAAVSDRAVREISRLRRSLDRRVIWTPPEPDRPVALAALADVHYGDSGVDYDALDRDIDLIARTDGMHLVFGGDGYDNHIKHMGAVLAQRMVPSDQLQNFGRILGKVAPKCVAAVGGNHEAWTCTLTNFDPLKPLCRSLAIPYDQHEIAIEVRMKGVTYKLAMRHKYRFNSSYNPEHSVRQFWAFGDEDFDVGIVCDQHTATVAPFVRHRRVRWAMRPGTYQTMGAHAAMGGFHGSIPVTPAVVLMPNRRELHCVSSLTWAIPLLNGVRRHGLPK